MSRMLWFVIGAVAASVFWFALIYLRNEQLLYDLLSAR